MKDGVCVLGTGDATLDLAERLRAEGVEVITLGTPGSALAAHAVQRGRFGAALVDGEAPDVLLGVTQLTEHDPHLEVRVVVSGPAAESFADGLQRSPLVPAQVQLLVLGEEALPVQQVRQAMARTAERRQTPEGLPGQGSPAPLGTLLTELVERLPLGVALVAQDGSVLSWNAACATLTGLPASKALGGCLWTLLGAPGQLRPLLDRPAGGGAIELLHELPGRSVRWLSLSAVAELHGATPGLRLVVIENATERRVQEEVVRHAERQFGASERLEGLARLAGGVAHDFNNLLVSVVGNADLGLMEAEPGSRMQRLLQAILDAGQRGSELADQLFLYAGKSKPVLAPVQLSQWISENVAHIRRNVPAGVLLELDLEDDLPIVEGDPRQLRRAIECLVTNAADACQGKRGLITLRTRSLTYPGPSGVPETRCCIEVADNGCGMAEETRERAFEPFYTTKESSRGLGLPSVFGIARMHRGDVIVESEPGRGTTARITLPALRASSPARGTDDAPASSAAVGARDMVLVIDDEPMVREAAQRMLESLGLRVATADGGPAGLAQYDEHADQLGLILLDATMPGMDGRAVLHALNERGNRTPVLFMSGYGQADALGVDPAAARVGFLQKPFSLAALTQTVQSTLARGPASPPHPAAPSGGRTTG